MDGILEPQEDLLGCEQSWISYFFGPETASVVYFLLKGLSRLPLELFVPFFSSAQDWPEISRKLRRGRKRIH